VGGTKDAVAALIPTWRRDIAIEADVAEEIVRVHGYDRVPSILPHTAMPPYRPSPVEVRDAIRETLIGGGLTEVVTYALVSPRHVESFRLRRPVASVAGDPEPAAGPVVVTNPLSRDHSVLRTGLIGGLVDVVAANARRGHDDVAIFEAGKGYGRDGDATREWWRVGLAVAGAADAASWNRPARPHDLDDAKGLVELLAKRLGFAAPAFSPEVDEPLFHPGRTARVEARDGAGRDVVLRGIVGQLHPDVLDAWEIRAPAVLIAELAIAGLAGGTIAAVRAVAPSRQPAVDRDLAVIVPESTPAGQVAVVIRAAGGELLRSVELFDIYRGAPLERTEKSVGHRLTFQSPDRTLTEAEVDQAVTRVAAALGRELGGRLRT
jgi:phenylalanyl-tRNA synthetase beta chain